MDGAHVIPDAIRDLLEKRATFLEWLTRLDDLGGEFRPEVAHKVRADYAGRLSAVEGELEGHRAELETALADRTARVDEVAAEHDARSAELEETQLRHAVGEFDDEEWERRRTEHQSQIDGLEQRLNDQRTAVESLQKVLAELAGSASAGKVAAAASQVEAEPPIPEEISVEPEWDAPDAVEAELEEAEATDAVEAEALEIEEDEESWSTPPSDEIVEVVVEEEAEAVIVVEEQTEVAQPEITEEVAAEPAEFMDELEFLESLSLDDTESFDAVSAMLDEEEGDSDSGEEDDRKPEGH